MNHRTHPMPPAAPAANHTGVVRRWKAATATAIAAVAGWIAGRYGVDDLAGSAAIGALTVLGARALLDERRRRARHELGLDSIDQHHHVRTLLGDHR